jgi:hypothetical protein
VPCLFPPLDVTARNDQWKRPSRLGSLGATQFDRPGNPKRAHLSERPPRIRHFDRALEGGHAGQAIHRSPPKLGHKLTPSRHPKAAFGICEALNRLFRDFHATTLSVGQLMALIDCPAHGSDPWRSGGYWRSRIPPWRADCHATRRGDHDGAAPQIVECRLNAPAGRW